jgi:hypothetical protein
MEVNLAYPDYENPVSWERDLSPGALRFLSASPLGEGARDLLASVFLLTCQRSVGILPLAMLKEANADAII